MLIYHCRHAVLGSSYGNENSEGLELEGLG